MLPEQIFGNVLRDLRKKSQISQETLAFQSNLDRTYISMLERHVHQPSLQSLFALAEALGMKASEFIELMEAEMEEVPYENKD
ncbi:helix-turn-helix transcriptional regulator [Gorillibacterium sp. CAU 1737]|uniref:helix-turn-helix domain-containing protein n=1 Tax=Gorillibacterium sp. CAU 1737 TaxID=3140362 RepID=UPI0032603655